MGLGTPDLSSYRSTWRNRIQSRERPNLNPDLAVSHGACQDTDLLHNLGTNCGKVCGLALRECRFRLESAGKVELELWKRQWAESLSQ